jgi:hypothetical protein
MLGEHDTSKMLSAEHASPSGDGCQASQSLMFFIHKWVRLVQY